MLHLVNRMGRGGRVQVAKAIGKSPDYISRMLYPKDKAGHKGIGEDTADLLDSVYPGWQVPKNAAHEPQLVYQAKKCNWPFLSVSEDEWLSIPEAERRVLERQIKAMVPTDTENIKTG